MFYRFQTGIVTSQRLDFKYTDNSFSLVLSQNRVSPGARFLVYVLDEIKMDPPWPKSKVYSVPKLTDTRHLSNLQFDKGKELQNLPDIITVGKVVVSDKVRKIILEVDDFEHQFFPMHFLNHLGEKLNTKQYYFMQIGRILDIKQRNTKPDVDFYAGHRSYLSTIQNSKNLRTKIESLPLWQHLSEYSNFYFNEKLFKRFKEEQVTGIEEYTEFSGDLEREQSVGHVW